MTPTLARVSQSAIVRLFLARWFRWLGRTASLVYPLAILLAVGLWLLGAGGPSIGVAVGLIVLQLVAVAGWAWYRRPSPVAALACWDKAAGRHEMFASALCFETSSACTDAERLHLMRTERVLGEAVAQLHRDLPAPLPRRAWMLPVAFLALVLALPAHSTPAGEPALNESQLAAAKQVGAALAQQSKLPETAKGLNSSEAAQLKKLQSSLEQTAEHLRKLKQEGQRDVLGELEQRAHDADKLADSLDGSADDLAASKMIAELERHADTTDLASALRAKDLEKSAEESKKLADRLEHKDLSLEERRRIEHALGKAAAVADKEERPSRLFKHVDQAHKELNRNQPKPAADQFKQLARHFASALQRRTAQKQLHQLASQLRNSGQQIFGQKNSGIRQLAQLPPGAALRPVSAQGNTPLPLAGMQLAPGASSPQGNAQLSTLPGQTPGAPVGSMAPVPGTMPGTPVPGVPGSAGSGQSPVPGTMGQSGSGQGQGQGQGAGQGQGQATGQGAGQGGVVPVPGTAAAVGQTAGTGGSQAGRGTGAYGNTPTTPMAAKQTGVVNATPTGQGPAQQRAIESGPRTEETRRAAQALAAEFIKAEEQALADEPLPISRRQQVLRYFTALRSQLVEPQPASNNTN